ncbi:unnamed protein product [Trichogramma brassicae]|uniref:Prospero domain-containing protein n=1 Tax=Trichogramma brassicae TaxID=86971 RepID=A0A6H5HX95_9HYME|nr:unnamed protein product [Trichogramma brassicae]
MANPAKKSLFCSRATLLSQANLRMYSRIYIDVDERARETKPLREFYYIQMEKYARQAVAEGIKCVEDLKVVGDSEIYRVLNLHYNRNNHIEVWNPQHDTTRIHFFASDHAEPSTLLLRFSLIYKYNKSTRLQKTHHYKSAMSRDTFTPTHHTRIL